MEEKTDLFSTKDWDKKLKQQEKESREYRHMIYNMVDIENKENILDVGCGTGAVTKDIASLSKARITAIDIDNEKIEIAKQYLKENDNVEFIEADVLDLPFPNNTFDLVVFNIVLIYISDQQKAVEEMARVTKKGGIVLASLEPDYESGIDYPEDPFYPLHLKRMTELGADLRTGRKLKYLFTKAGLETEVGMDTITDYIYIRNKEKMLKMFKDQFWVVEKIFQDNGWSEKEIEKYRSEQIDLIKKGLKFHFSCAFYSIGKKL